MHHDLIFAVIIIVYKKHYPPALHDEVWRLDRIAKDGALHKKLVNANILTVEDFLRFLVRDPQRLRNVRSHFSLSNIPFMCSPLFFLLPICSF